MNIPNIKRYSKHRSAELAFAMSVLLSFSILLGATVPKAQAAEAVYNAVVYKVTNPNSSRSILTTDQAEVNSMKGLGYTEVTAEFMASSTSKPGLKPVYRIDSTSDLSNVSSTYTVWASERDSAVRRLNYVDKGIAFYASETAKADTQPVYRLYKTGVFNVALGQQAASQLIASGWSDNGIKFHAAVTNVTVPADPVDPVDPVNPTIPADADGKFSVAIMPDTQVEVHSSNDNRFAGRTQWLADNKENLDLRFVGHSGDVTNWGWIVQSQLAIASNAMTKLEQANLPYALSIGNHDTRAVGHDGVTGSRGYGGSAYINNPECVERLSVALCKTGLLQHDTREFNAVFNKDRYTSVAGAYQVGKVDNIYSTFKAAGQDWMMITLEMNARAEVVDWAKGVVASHPNHNVMVQTHQFMNGNGSISSSGGYGDGSRSGQYLFDNLIKQYPNIVATFSGHVGVSNIRTDTGVNGNKIVSYLQTFHSRTTNPVRLLEFDVNANSIKTSVYAPHTNETMVSNSTQSNMSFVNP